MGSCINTIAFSAKNRGICESDHSGRQKLNNESWIRVLFNYRQTDITIVSATELKVRENGNHLSMESKQTLVGHYQNFAEVRNQ